VRRRVLDLYCCEGGAGMGYHRAGLDVVGIDKERQARYPFPCLEYDAITVLDGLISDGAFSWLNLRDFDAVHASPPCQRKSRMTNCRPGLAETYPDLIGPTRDRLRALGLPWVMENVEGAGLPGQNDLFGANGLTLCGHMFGLRLYRHRFFETSFSISPPHHPRHLTPASKAGHWQPGTIISVEGNCAPIAEAREAMGIGWMTRGGLVEAIPPAYTEYIGSALLAAIEAGRAA
jgi:DNA (cytosine-5)-methyltransferase 1